MSIEPGVLYVVATPIGNLEDLSPRALRVLSEVDYIAAEDTRCSRQMLRHFGIRKPLVSLHEHNERSRIPKLLEDLLAGRSIALVSDAGTPLISDPGYALLRSLRERGLRAVPIPGPSSLLAALSVAGLPTDRFCFEGFLPAKSAARRSRLESLRDDSHTLVFFEAGRRIRSSLEDMAAVFGPLRPAVVARELTKLFEEIHGASLRELCEWTSADERHCLGEFVVIVAGAPEKTEDEKDEDQTRRLLKVLLEELPIKQAVHLAAKLTRARKRTLYELALSIRGR